MIQIHQDQLKEFGTEIFYKIAGRGSKKPKTGIRIVVDIPGTSNVCMVSIQEPSILSQFLAVEKTVRTHNVSGATSQDSENEEYMRYRGCVSYVFHDYKVHVSVDGMKKQTENVVIAMIVLSQVIEKSINEIADNIQERGGKIPAEILDENHYLYNILYEYQ